MKMNFLQKLCSPALGLAINSDSAEVSPVLIGVACNAAVSASADWQLLCPYCESAYWRKEGQAWRQYKQVFTKGQGEQMVASYNATAGERGANWRGLSVYVGHPDADPARWPDDKRLGGVMAMETREDGLYVKVAWNDIGLKNCEQGYYVHPSPAWLYDIPSAQRTGVIAPTQLKSIGLTNNPNIQAVPAWTNTKPNANDDMANDAKLRSRLTKLFGLPDDATDEQLDAAEDSHLKLKADSEAKEKASKEKSAKEKADKDKETADNAAKALQDEATKFRGIAINNAVAVALNTGKITAADKPGWETKLAANYDTAVKELEALKPALDTKSLGLKPTSADGDLTTAHGRSIAFNAAVGRHMASGAKSLDDAIALMRGKPEELAILTSMEAPKKP